MMTMPVPEVEIAATNHGEWLFVQGTPEEAVLAFERKHGYTPSAWARNPLKGHVLVGPVEEVQ